MSRGYGNAYEPDGIRKTVLGVAVSFAITAPFVDYDSVGELAGKTAVATTVGIPIGWGLWELGEAIYVRVRRPRRPNTSAAFDDV